MTKTVLSVVVVIALLVIAGWYYVSPETFMGIGTQTAVQPPAFPE